MNAKQIIDTCNTMEFSRKQFRKEINLSFLINDVKKQFMISGNGDGGLSSSSNFPSPLIKTTEKGGENGNIKKKD